DGGHGSRHYGLAGTGPATTGWRAQVPPLRTAGTGPATTGWRKQVPLLRPDERLLDFTLIGQFIAGQQFVDRDETLQPVRFEEPVGDRQRTQAECAVDLGFPSRQ